MTKSQKIIKYFAISLAMLLIISIIFGIVTVVEQISKGITFDTIAIDNNCKKIDYEKYNSYLDINIKDAELRIYGSEKFKFISSEEKIVLEKIGETKLRIIDKRPKHIKTIEDTPIVTIYVPNELVYEMVNINFGVGKLKIEEIETKEFNLNLGAGESTLEKLYSDKTTIDTGAGDLKVNNSRLSDLNLDIGVGEIKLNSYISGNSNINCGVGNLNLELPDYLESYTIKVEKGLGIITYNNKKLDNNKTLGEGPNKIKIDDGVGSIKITTADIEK